jgi:hypothetical protein
VGTKAQSVEETATEETEAKWGENIKVMAAEEETAMAEATPPRSQRLHCDGAEYSTAASRKMQKADAPAAEEAAAAGKAETTTAALKKGAATEEAAPSRDEFRQPGGRRRGKALLAEFLPSL